jgi:hypothetical protein
MLDPYDILGIKPDSDWKTIKKAYKSMLNKTHPDKMGGNAKYFMLVHDAFSHLEKSFNDSRRFRDAPKKKEHYVPHEAPELPKSMKNFTNTKFNNYFETNKITHNEYMNNGYGNSMCQSLNFQEESGELMRNKVNIPKQQLVIYKDPNPMVSSILDNCYQLGVEKVDDFTCQQGTDVMQAYSERAELIDTVKKYKNIDDINQARSSQNMTLTSEEKTNMQERDTQRRRLEQYRLQRMRLHDSSLNERYTELHRRLK